MSRGFRKCMPKGCRGCLRPITAGRKWPWPSFQDLSRPNCGVTNQRHSANFRPIVLKRIEHGLQYDVGRVSLISNTSYFFVTWPLWAAIIWSDGSVTQTKYIFWILSKHSVGTSPKNFTVENFRVQCVLPKKSLFCQFLCTDGEKSIEAVCAQFWCQPHST